MIENIGSPITVRRMADHNLLSRLTFMRRFVSETGMPPMHGVTGRRVLGARRLLEASDWSVERIAGATGFGTAANFRTPFRGETGTLFRRETGTAPSAYRKAHGAVDAA